MGLGVRDNVLSAIWARMHACMLSHVWLFGIPWTVGCQTPLSMEFSRQEYWSRLPFPSPGDFHIPRMESGSPTFRQILYQCASWESLPGYSSPLTNLPWMVVFSWREPQRPSVRAHSLFGLSVEEANIWHQVFMWYTWNWDQWLILSLLRATALGQGDLTELSWHPKNNPLKCSLLAWWYHDGRLQDHILTLPIFLGPSNLTLAIFIELFLYVRNWAKYLCQETNW